MRAGWSSENNQLGIGEALSRAACRGAADDIHLPGLLSENHLCDREHLRRDGWLCLYLGEDVLGQIQSLSNDGEHHVCKRKDVFREAKDPLREGKDLFRQGEHFLHSRQRLLRDRQHLFRHKHDARRKPKIFSMIP